MFTGQRIKNFAVSRNISMITSTPYYAQANGQVEAENKILISLIKKYIGNKPRTWHETLSQVLWAYRNSPRGSTNTSPYKLVYGHDAVLSLEINLNTLRISKQNDLPVDNYWNAMFDELNELDLERILALDDMIRQKENIARSYNRRIREKYFNTGELVLKVFLPMEKKSKFLGKWSQTWEGPFQVIGSYSGNTYQIKDIESGKEEFGIQPVEGGWRILEEFLKLWIETSLNLSSQQFERQNQNLEPSGSQQKAQSD
ncbi:uncharacterized protein LOC107640043 [Arachis ipaensis]|uniref:uncharacterized protein LOC107640043 n=1 Tax=Arachis ipaensis TaxID=130454 RepID=UPI0007AFA2B0|nr:uncharacterized protein LOC107640043 [Arachis ipaensis]